MRISRLLFALVLLGIACPGGRDPTPEELRRVTYSSMAQFESEKDFESYLDEVRSLRSKTGGTSYGIYGCADSSAPQSAIEAPQGDESITNNQVDGVDEGDIVKAIGDYLVILRRGRLFSVLQGERLTPISQVNAFPPGFSGGTWYDEMLVHEDRIIVIGYSYELGATEIGLFQIEQGRLSHVASHFISSNDYYSSRNYASRLADGKLILYMPYFLFASWWQPDRDDESLPTIQTWIRGDELTRPKPLISARSIRKPVQGTTYPALHTVLTCDLAGGDFDCSARGVIGPYSRTFYVSNDAVYVWVSPGYFGGGAGERDEARSYVYRMGLGSDRVGVVRSFGAPIDQFSFHESDTHLNVVLSDSGAGDWMWAPELNGGNLALLRVPLERFRGEASIEPKSSYRRLPRPSGYAIQNRFVGQHLLYGSGSGWYDASSDRRLFVTRYVGGEVATVPLRHDAQRIEVMGDGAVVVGSDGTDLVFTSIALGAVPSAADVFRRSNAAQGETRSHGFFFKRSQEGGGVLGLPVRLQGGAYAHLLYGSAEVQFLRTDESLRFADLGALRAGDATSDDACQVSCVDWYGNARPIFYRGRTYALMGYEIVEGRVSGDRMVEIQRVDYASVD